MQHLLIREEDLKEITNLIVKHVYNEAEQPNINPNYLHDYVDLLSNLNQHKVAATVEKTLNKSGHIRNESADFAIAE